ncbi:hypothetical protein, partial [Vibrio parahaemolyticus]|uniref:hypothetical protein n=1 Tax=Vibrio parahaemolyticus TaxID=670 RepID=UPI001A8D3E33
LIIRRGVFIGNTLRLGFFHLRLSVFLQAKILFYANSLYLQMPGAADKKANYQIFNSSRIKR